MYFKMLVLVHYVTTIPINNSLFLLRNCLKYYIYLSIIWQMFANILWHLHWCKNPLQYLRLFFVKFTLSFQLCEQVRFQDGLWSGCCYCILQSRVITPQRCQYCLYIIIIYNRSINYIVITGPNIWAILVFFFIYLHI